MSELPKPTEVIDPKTPEGLMRTCAFIHEFRGIKFLAINAPLVDAKAFEALDRPETGHAALMAFYWDGKAWSITLYRAAHKPDTDLAAVVKRYKGTEEDGAFRFKTDQIPFPLFHESIMMGNIVKSV